MYGIADIRDDTGRRRVFRDGGEEVAAFAEGCLEIPKEGTTLEYDYSRITSVVVLPSGEGLYVLVQTGSDYSPGIRFSDAGTGHRFAAELRCRRPRPADLSGSGGR